jgi:hypothetical protein
MSCYNCFEVLHSYYRQMNGSGGGGGGDSHELGKPWHCSGGNSNCYCTIAANCIVSQAVVSHVPTEPVERNARSNVGLRLPHSIDRMCWWLDRALARLAAPAASMALSYTGKMDGYKRT